MGVDFHGFNPEGFFSPDTRERVLVLSDDGSLPIDGVPCKKLPDQAAKRFRGAWLSVGPANPVSDAASGERAPAPG